MSEILVAALNSWREVNQQLHAFREDQVLWMLKHEMKHQKRWTVVERLHQRYNILRGKRERAELEHEINS